MLEILFVFFLSSKIGKIAVDKGHKSGGYRALAITLWFVGEIVGIIIGFSIAKGFVIYVYAIICALVGIGISFVIVSLLKVKEGEFEKPEETISYSVDYSRDNDLYKSDGIKLGDVIIIDRQSFFEAILAKFYLYMDGIEIGNIGNGEQKEYKTTQTGQHIFIVKTKLGMQSDPLPVNLTSNEVIELSCGIKRGFLKSSLFFVEKSRNKITG